jgi:uncharacterized protein
MRRTLIVMLKEPRPGRVKTRLGADIGMVPAAWWYRHQSAALLRRLRDPRWRLVLAVSPDPQGLASRVWPGDLTRMPQGRGDLGARMRAQLLAPPPGPVCVVGADIPGLRRAHVWRAFRALGGHDTVFGPATDGGYWLVGLKRARAVPPGLFARVRWSGRGALSDSIDSCAGMRVALVDRLRDVDTVDDLRPLGSARDIQGFQSAHDQ